MCWMIRTENRSRRGVGGRAVVSGPGLDNGGDSPQLRSSSVRAGHLSLGGVSEVGGGRHPAERVARGNASSGGRR